MVGLFSKSLFSKIQNLAFLKQSLALFSYKLLATLQLIATADVTWPVPFNMMCVSESALHTENKIESRV